MKKFVWWMIDVLRLIMETLGFLFMYAFIIYAVTDGAMVGKIGWILTAVGAAASASLLYFATWHLEVTDNA